MNSGLLSPARIWVVVSGRLYEYRNNSLEARWNLWNAWQWNNILRGDMNAYY